MNSRKTAHRRKKTGGFAFKPVDASLWWCTHCGVPLLDQVCGICGKNGNVMKVSPPGDVRPCMGDTCGMIENLLKDDYGCSPGLNGRMVLLNRIAGEDRTDEIYVGAKKFGTLRYCVLENAFGIDLTAYGAALVLMSAEKNVIETRFPRGHLAGKFLPLDAEDPPGTKVIVTDGRKVAWGVIGEKGGATGVRIKDVGPVDVEMPPRADMKKALEANEEHIRAMEKKALAEIRSIVKDFSKLNIAFSGGKDSLAVLLLLLELRKSQKNGGDDVKMIYNDTGLEFPETVDYVHRISSLTGIELLVASASDAFWTALPHMGPPAKDYRWCCKVTKLAPIARLLKDHYPRGCFTLSGRRKYESFSRSRINAVEDSPFVKGQKEVLPIRDWSALAVWLYILRGKLPYNPLYDRDIQRIGCYLCPSSMLSELDGLRKTHRELAEMWDDRLREWFGGTRGVERIVKHGFWRWSVPPPKMRVIMKELELDPNSLLRGHRWPYRTTELCSTGEVRVSVSPGVLAEGDEIVRLTAILGTLGYARSSQRRKLIRVKARSFRAVVGSGSISVTASDEKKAREGLNMIRAVISRWRDCLGCGLCESACPVECIDIRDGILRIDTSRCRSCSTCNEVCPLVRYSDRRDLCESRGLQR